MDLMVLQQAKDINPTLQFDNSANTSVTVPIQGSVTLPIQGTEQ